MWDLETFCKMMPKCEFNARWEACINKSHFWLLEDRRRSLGERPFTTKERKLLWAYGKPRNMDEVMRLMPLLHEMVHQPYDVFTITDDIIKRYYDDNVVYLELRVRPFVSRHMTAEEFLKGMISAITVARAKYPRITVRLLLSIKWQEESNEAEKIVNMAIANLKHRADTSDPTTQIIRGIEVFGDPDGDALQFFDLLEKARNKNLIIVYNLADVGRNVDELYDILLTVPDRLSNAGVLHNIRNDPTYRNLCFDRLISMKIPVDVCYTANELMRPQSKYSGTVSHCVYLYGMNQPMLISTGYSALLGCSLSDEYHRVALKLKLKPAQIFELSRMAAFYITSMTDSNLPMKHPFKSRYDAFAIIFGLDYSANQLRRLFQTCYFVISRPIRDRTIRRLRRRIRESTATDRT